MRAWISLVFLIDFFALQARDPYKRNEAVDVLHYFFQLDLCDSTNSIEGVAHITIAFRKSVLQFELDLVGKDSVGNGMVVTAVESDRGTVTYAHQHDRLLIRFSEGQAPAHVTITIRYHGVPRDGLIIGRNKYGDRTFFGDNWPDRARHWLPTVDHPSDKATCEFAVTAPEQYEVIGNGLKTEESSLTRGRKLTRWEEHIPIPTKVMIIGAARFAIQRVGTVENIPVESWVYPQNREAGFADYSDAVPVLEFFYSHIGPYPYEKLANVQSTTRYGGMENASAIFYFENSVTGKKQSEGLIAHEIAHQWFGNSASEKDWHHVWLSEGFATYLSHLYLEFTHGHDRMVADMKADREQVIGYSKENQMPVIDTTVTELTRLLNINSYQKASWVLHMLRREVGDRDFWKGLQEYYRRFRDANALTDDLQGIMEEASGKNLDTFFQQWLWRSGNPVLRTRWKYDPARRTLDVSVDQTQAGAPFALPLDIGITTAAGTQEVHTVKLAARTGTFIIPVDKKPFTVVLDPGTWLLFEPGKN